MTCTSMSDPIAVLPDRHPHRAALARPGDRRRGPRGAVALRGAVLARAPRPVVHVAPAPAGGRPRRRRPTATSSTWPSPPPSSGSAPVGAALAVPPLDRPVLPVRRRPPDRRDHPAGAAQAPAAHPDPDRPPARRAPAGPRGVDGPARARAPRATSCGSEPAAWRSRSSSSARTPRPPSASSTPGGCTPPSPTTPSPGPSSTARSPSASPPTDLPPEAA